MAKSSQGRKSRKPSSNGRNSQMRNKRGSGSRDECRDYRKDSEPKAQYNDISWYSRYPQLLVGAGQIAYPYRPGMKLDIAPTGVSTSVLPGVLAIDWVPSFGVSAGANDPASRVAQELYTRVRASYSGALDADGPDMLMYLGALDSIYAYIGWLKRLYRAISTYSPDNFGLPMALLEATNVADSLGITQRAALYAKLRARKDLLFTGINELILMTQKFRCPAVMDIFNRHYWMSDGVYADANSTRAQLYCFNLVGVYQLQQLQMHGSTDKAAGLQMIALNFSFTASTTPDEAVDALISKGVSLISALDTWDDGYTIAGYLTRAYEGAPDFKIAPLLQNELVTATYSEEVLSQIENAHACINMGTTIPNAVQNMQVVQDVTTNTIWTNQSITLTSSAANILTMQAPGLLKQQVLNVRSESPSVGDTVIATRLHNTATYAVNGTSITIKPDSGSEVVTQFRLCNVTPSGATSVDAVQQYLVLGSNKIQNSDLIDAFRVYAQLSLFDWHPLCYLVTYAPSPDNELNSIDVIGDVLNPTTITPAQLSTINRYCLYSEFNAFSIS